ncbi:GNAT family N-acetyltransferase [Microvirga flavescens]|uniref:GNAT family N-acetyltransferase n=1 Tax=Microvirga flavescens TaxID=2249811 RepID=UPI000DD9BD6A|nr:GNAT family N-acetyltransferase [Microvirga flavescens]
MSFLDRFRARPSIRFATLGTDQAPRLAAIHASAFARAWDVPEFERLLGERSIAAEGLFLGSAHAPSGFVLSRVVLDEAEILTVAMGPEARGKGHARPLLARHFEDLERRGVRHVHLEVEDGNVAALALYRRLGFREIGRREGYYLKADGSRATALTMSLSL